MHYIVVSAEQAAAVVEYFNGFHDGFIRRLSLISHDTFEDRDTHLTTGLLDLEVLFAHSNYHDGRPPFDQLVHARFSAGPAHGLHWSASRLAHHESPPGDRCLDHLNGGATASRSADTAAAC
jgi:hypothetical protein